MMGRGLWSNHERYSYSVSRPSLPLLLLLVAGFSNNQVVVGLDANPKSAFTFPEEDGMTYHLNDVVMVSYVSSFPEPGLYAWCRESDGVKNVFTKEPAAGYNGTQPVTIDFTSDGDCWWNLRRIFNTPDGANGPGFKLSASEREGGPQIISRESPKPTSSSRTTAIKSPPSPQAQSQPQSSTTASTSPASTSLTPSAGSSTSTTSTSSLLRSNPTASTLSTSTTGTGTGTSATSTPSSKESSPQNSTNSNADNSSGGLSTGAAAGIGVAVGVVVLILLIAMVLYLRKWKSSVIAEAVKASSNAATPAGTPPYPVYASLNGAGAGGGAQGMTQTTVEAYTPSQYEARGLGAQGSVYQTYPGTGVAAGGQYQYHHQQQVKPPEEMDVEPQTAEMEGDATYGAKFQREQYR